MARPEEDLSADLVRELLRDQHPDLAEGPLRLGARGWDNEIWRLGENLAVRLPWQTDDADALLLKEYTWVPLLARLLPLPVPVPQRLGRPSQRYPHPWIVTTWIPGTPADQAPATQSGSAADSLTAFLKALHKPAPAGAPTGRGRGEALTQVAEDVASQLASSMADLCAEVAGAERELIPDADTIRAIWDDAVCAPGWAGPPLWLHGDLHPANVLTEDGTFCGVVDFGDLCAGDPALDLAACWLLLPDAKAIERLQRTYPLDSGDATWRRAQGWAVWRALGSLSIAAAPQPGGKPSWGRPALVSLRRLAASFI